MSSAQLSCHPKYLFECAAELPWHQPYGVVKSHYFGAKTNDVSLVDVFVLETRQHVALTHRATPQMSKKLCSIFMVFLMFF